MAWTPKFTFSVTWDNITGKPLNYPTTWSLVGGKPSTFPSTWATVSGKPETATRWPSWGEVTGKPSIPQGTVTSVSAGNGMSFSTITGSGAVALGTPGTLSGSTTNSVTTSSHTHALSANLSAWDGVTVASKADSARTITAGNGLSGGGNLTANRTITLGTPGTLSGSTNNSVTSGSHTHALSANLSSWDSYHSDNAWVDKGLIPGSQDLNNYTTTGVYHQSMNANASSGTNYPASVAGMLVVFNSSSMTYQTYQAYNSGDVWTRSRYNTSWSAWKLSVDGTTTITAGNGLSGGGSLAANRTISMGTPGTITATSTNSVSSTSHTHNLDTTGNFTWNGNHIFVGDMIARSSSASSQMTVERTGNSINSAIAYTTTGGTIYAGQGDNGSFNWGSSADIRWNNSTTWGQLNSSGLSISGTITATGQMYGTYLNATGNRIYGGSSGDLWVVGNGSNGIGFRPRGWATANQTYINNNGSMSVGGDLSVSGGISSSGDINSSTIVYARTGLRRRHADNSAWGDQPRIFVQSGDPGARAETGDLWIW